MEEYIKKILITGEKTSKLSEAFGKKQPKAALKILPKQCDINELEKDIQTMLEEDSKEDGLALTLLTKIIYQRHFNLKLYPSVDLPEDILKKLKSFLTKKINLLIKRQKALEKILIDEDDEIRETWNWGKSKEIKYHMKFLMRQRYLREPTMRAAMDMAFFDCVNILKKSPFSELFEKSIDLFEGINLRNLVSHRSNIPEAIGEILDKDDFPSQMIEKMLMLIDDGKAIESILELFREANILEKAKFIDWIQSNKCAKYVKAIETIKACDRWKDYLTLFPFI